MNVFVESLKRLYQSGRIDQDKVSELASSGKITENEKQEIINTRNEP